MRPMAVTATSGAPGEAIAAPRPRRREVVAVRRGIPIGAIVGTVVVLLLIGLGAGAFFISQQNPPDKVAYEFFTAGLKGDAATVEQLVVPEHREKARKKATEVAEGLKKLSQRAGGQAVSDPLQFLKVSVSSVEKKGSEATVKIALELNIPNLPISMKIDLPVVVVRRYFVLWRVDLDKTDAAQKQAAEAMLKQFLPFMGTTPR